MALSTKLELRHSQALVMTPQLQQAIKLLQLSNIELTNFVETELERNPLLERNEADGEPALAAAQNQTPELEAPLIMSNDMRATDDWLKSSERLTGKDAADGLDTDFENIYPENNEASSESFSAFSQSSMWSSQNVRNSSASDDDVNLEAFVAEKPTLQDHLTGQLNLAFSDPTKRLIGQNFIDMVDEAGYLRETTENIAERLGAPLALVEETLQILQGFDPAGVFARNLSECLALQLKERNRYDPEIAKLLAHLDLLGKHDFTALKKLFSDPEDLADMIAEIKMLDPKPGLRFGTVTVQPVVPDVLVRKRNDGGWHVELNNETLPKVLVNQHYYATVSKTARSDQEKNYLQDCFQTANWLVKSLDQRARTILKVAQEIVRQQDAFLTHGVQYLRPLNLKTVADAISMHESTVSRVTSNKYIATNRGIFELKYFFTSAIASSDMGESHSSEAVRYRIKQMIDHEDPNNILSDDKIVENLKAEGIDIARRTVAKYRESMKISSSVQRRREKKTL